jgi:hypothetical protein
MRERSATPYAQPRNAARRGRTPLEQHVDENHLDESAAGAVSTVRGALRHLPRQGNLAKAAVATVAASTRRNEWDYE